ncbi:helix-turn-helix transcriptional regulator [Bradyrhizobium sp. IC3195]|uniref:helix-turn-helix domain-containing protein n=1 Tax=Bradyrhizobium sp. IC3195 TaxID=2793804 RepID=UPI001CD44102|nr:helix-turn-helix transcriptional regulator [Bradyrhizobium sp. IC3195]
MPRDNDCERNVALSQREISCLRWLARGKLSWEMGKIMNISENTVNFISKMRCESSVRPAGFRRSL